MCQHEKMRWRCGRLRRMAAIIAIWLCVRCAAAAEPMLVPVGQSALPSGDGLAVEMVGNEALSRHDAVIFLDDFESGAIGELAGCNVVSGSGAGTASGGALCQVRGSGGPGAGSLGSSSGGMTGMWSCGGGSTSVVAASS